MKELNNLKVSIVTEGGKDIGFGHITRCKSLYQAFKEKGATLAFITNDDQAALDMLRGINCFTFNWHGEQQRLFYIIKNADIVIIDSYLADVYFYKKVSEIVKIPVYLDDNIRLDYPNGMLVNGNIFAEGLKYPKREDITYLLGSQYVPLRREFWELPEKAMGENIDAVMISFGGDDARNMTPKILKLMREKYPDIIKNVVIGRAFKNIEDIKKIVDDKTNLIYYPDAEGMKQVMFESDIAISLSGQTLYELAATGVPTVAVVVADNQMNNMRGCLNAGFIVYAGWWADKEILNNIIRAIELLEDRDARVNMAKTGRALIDGNGASRVVEEVMKRAKFRHYLISRKGMAQ